MQDNAKLDNALAAFTDQLLAGQTPHASPEIEELAQVVRQAHNLIVPAQQPSVEYRAQLAQRLSREWTSQHRSRHWRAGRRAQITALAAGVAVVLFVVALAATAIADAEGTAAGSPALIGAAAVVIALMIGAVWVWLSQRRHS